MTNEQAAAPTALAPYRSTEETRLRYSNSCTVVDITGTAPNGEHYNLAVFRTGKTVVRVSWSVSTYRAKASYELHAKQYWGKRWSATFRTEAAALNFAAGKLEVLRDWADKRAAEAA
jgi:hypothetical protein